MDGKGNLTVAPQQKGHSKSLGNEHCKYDFFRRESPWVVVPKIFYFHFYLGKVSNLTNIFQMGWNHQPEICWTKSCMILWVIEWDLYIEGDIKLDTNLHGHVEEFPL